MSPDSHNQPASGSWTQKLLAALRKDGGERRDEALPGPAAWPSHVEEPLPEPVDYAGPVMPVRMDAREALDPVLANHRLEQDWPVSVPGAAMGPEAVSSDLPSANQSFSDTLAFKGVSSFANEAMPAEDFPVSDVPLPAATRLGSYTDSVVSTESIVSGGNMTDLSGYRDLSKAPTAGSENGEGSEHYFGGGLSAGVVHAESSFERYTPSATPSNLGGYGGEHSLQAAVATSHSHAASHASQDLDTEFSGNVKTLIRLVNELPEGVTKQTGAQIIRLTMEAMGISMEDVLTEAQSAQSEMLDAVRANIKKIEEYKTVIRKLETDIKYYQGKANELSEIIDLFILSNTSPGNKMPSADDLA